MKCRDKIYLLVKYCFFFLVVTSCKSSISVDQKNSADFLKGIFIYAIPKMILKITCKLGKLDILGAFFSIFVN